ncbi:MAG TPA: S8 family serine peptidase [Kiritimatiellia bacterium]|nr:S8 family serine peptidase [Kiritimatiellia bacterium]
MNLRRGLWLTGFFVCIAAICILLVPRKPPTPATPLAALAVAPESTESTEDGEAVAAPPAPTGTNASAATEAPDGDESAPSAPAVTGGPAPAQTAIPPAQVATPDAAQGLSADASQEESQPDSERESVKSSRRRAAPASGDAAGSIAELLNNADLSDPATRARVVAEMTAREEARYAAVLEKAAELGIPVRKEGPGNKVSILHDFRGDEPVYRTTMNRNAAISSTANLLAPAPYSLNGAGIKVGVWDAGSVRRTHQEFTLGRVTNINAVATDDHATHVAGTIGAAGVSATARGMATNVTIASYDWDNDYAEMTATGAVSATQSNMVPISNHSYGYDAGTSDMGVYNSEAVTMDALLAGLPFYLPFWAAGNEQDVLTAKGGYQSITYLGLAKNLITIGAVNDAVSGTNRSLAGASIAYFSSLGPSDDGRIKPDIVANGIDLYSTVDSSDTAYDSYSGTSMATPSSAGSAALLAQLYRREFSGQFMRASMLKALLIHTADDLGRPGPDYMFGWGHINTKAAADVILAHKASPGAPKMINGTITPSARAFTNEFIWNGSSPIRATLAWTDPAGSAQADNSRTPVLRNNLDLRIIAPNGTTVYQPYVMPFVGNWSDAFMTNAATTGSNYVDNVERVDIAAPAQVGTYKVIVSYGGTLFSTSQVYSLVLTGGTDADQAVVANAGIALVSDSCGGGNGMPDPGELIGVTLALRNTGTINTTNLIATLLATNGVTAPSAAQNYGALVAGGATVTNSFTFIASGACGDSITVSFALADGTNLYDTISQTYTLGGTTAVTVTNANSAAITIVDNNKASPYPSTINVSGLAGTVTKVTVTIAGLSHTYPEDLDIVVASPDGRRVALLGAVGGGTDISGLTLTFDDDAASSVGSPITGGAFKPTGSISSMPAPAPAAPYAGSLAEFIGANPNGTWSLYVVDAAADDSGNIASGWRIAITAGEPLCCASNQPPAFATVGDKTVVDGRTLNFAVTATDSVDNDPITLTAPILPAGATFGATNGTGSFAWSSATPVGVYTSRFVATDKDGAATQDVAIIVVSNQPPLLAPVGDRQVYLTNTLSFAVTATDPVGDDAILLTASNLPAGATFGATNGTGAFLWPDASPTGAYLVTFHAADISGTNSETITITVAPAPAFVTYIEDFDTTENWGGGAPGSYNTKSYTNNNALPAGDYFESNGAIRDTIDSISGNAWRLGNDSAANLYFRYVITNTVRRFAFGIARWDNSPTPQFQIRYSTNSGGAYTTLLSTNGSWFTADKQYRTYDSGPVDLTPAAGQKIYIELFRSSGERMLVDNFEVDYIPAGGGGGDPPPAAPPAPAAIWASATNATDFTAAWSAVSTATSYRLDVSTSAVFSAGGGSAVLYSNAFTSFTGAGFAPTPSAGQLDSDEWKITGLSDNTSPVFGGTYTSGDFARGSSTGNVSTGGAYGFNVGGGNIALGIQPAGSDWTPGTIVLRVENNTGSTLTELNVSYRIYVRNDQNWASSFNFAHSSTDSGYTAVPALDYTSPATADAPPTWVAVDRATTLTGLSIADGAFYYLQWNGDDVSGSGSRDEFALDDVLVTTATGMPSYIPGYSNRTVAGTSEVVTGLTEGVTYFFRARAVNTEGASPNSPTGSVVTAASSNPDADGDGIPDAYEIELFGSTTNIGIGTDWDNDGFLDVDEYRAGTSPTNPASLLQLESTATAPAGEVVIRWQSATGRVYGVSRSTNLMSGFSPLATNLPAFPPENVWTDVAPPSAGGHYRIDLEAP